MLQYTLALILGNCSVWQLSELTNHNLVKVLPYSVAIMYWLIPLRQWLFVLIFSCSLIYTHYQLNLYLAHKVPSSLENKLVNVKGVIVDIPVYFNNRVKFTFKVEECEENWRLPAKVSLTWQSKQLVVGQQLSLQVKLKRIRMYANPGSFDREKYALQQGIVAEGRVVNLVSLQPGSNNLRQTVLNKLLLYPQLQHLGVIIAMVIGYRAKIDSLTLQVFNDSGTAHLIAISGLHIGYVAAFTYKLTKTMIADHRKVSLITIIISCIYSSLAGFSLATQRACIMISTFMCFQLLQRYILLRQALCIAMWIILLIDPFATLSYGFWLSFIAIIALQYASSSSIPKYNWLLPHWYIFLILLPITISGFSKYSWASLPANIISIPIFSLFILPFALVGTCLVWILPTIAGWLLGWANLFLELLIKFNSYLLGKLAVVNFPQLTLLQVLLITVAMLWLLAPRKTPGKYFALILIIPIFFHSSTPILDGELKVTFLDVGQGLSVFVQTANHNLLFDTGYGNDYMDLGQQVIIPYLQAKAINKLNMLIISHPDSDHIGGAKSVLTSLNVDKVLISDTNYLQAHNPNLCRAGQSWQWDGVEFELLHPHLPARAKRNDISCVLAIRNNQHQVLLTGDISSKVERQLINNYSDKLPTTILQVPHHGSNSSSSPEFIDRLSPSFAIASVGYLNNYRHPHKTVVDRYHTKKVKFLTTVDCGAIEFYLHRQFNKNLEEKCYRIIHQKVWFDKYAKK